jgi:sugar phosphate isomerase/epimerase
MRGPAMARRGFLAAVGGTAPTAGTATGGPAQRRRGIPLGFDNFAVRALDWDVGQLVDHAVTLGCDAVFVTDFGPFRGKTDDATLAEVRARAADRGVAILLGSWSICPSARRFKADWGTAEEHLALGIRMAKALGSPAFRVILGDQSDRLSPGGIAARIADTVAVLQACRPLALDANVKIAVENHAGDMTSRELLALVEEAGPDVVGVNFDSGNACWALEDPVAALDRLAPHVLSTSLRDTMVWETAGGVAMQWTAMGEGCTDLARLFDVFEKRCPGVTANIETISGFPREFSLFDREFWRAYPDVRGEDLAGLLALAKRGRAIDPFQAPAGGDRKQAEREHQLAELARSIAHCRDVLGLGVRGS